MNLKFGIASGRQGDNAAGRPIIMYDKMRFMFDTGASVPVWCVGKTRFLSVFPDAIKQEFKYIINGFGRTEKELRDFMSNPNAEEAAYFLLDVYSIPSFNLSTDNGTVAWKNLRIAVTAKDGVGADLILPSPMFRGMTLHLNQENPLNPFIEIETTTDTKYVFMQEYDKQFYGTKLMKYIYSQDALELMDS